MEQKPGAFIKPICFLLFIFLLSACQLAGQEPTEESQRVEEKTPSPTPVEENSAPEIQFHIVQTLGRGSISDVQTLNNREQIAVLTHKAIWIYNSND